MLQPEALLYWDNEGYVTAFGDSNNAVGWPPWGAMNVGPGFFGRGVVSYQYGPLYYRDGQVHSAYDHAMRLGYFPPDRIDEIWDAFRLYRRHTPQRHHPTVAYLYAQAWSSLAPERLDPLGYPHNTADESIIFAYEEANRASTLNGFFLEPEHLSELTPDQVDTLVLPPLTHADAETLSAIRALHAQGVHLVAFEAVPGLEDLFGVQPATPSADVVTITPADGEMHPNWLLGIHPSRVRHSGDVRQVSHALTDGHALLVGRDADDRVIAPVLVRRDGPTARALLWTLPPTDIARSRNHTGHRLRGECMSALIRTAMGRALQEITTTAVKSSAGHLVSFYDAEDRLVVIVYENAFPFEAQSLHPLVSIEIPGIGAKTITANRAVRDGLHEPDRRTFAFDLDENDVAVFVFEP